MSKIEKAAVMARVSTGRQLDNTSPDEQIRRGREYCAERGYKVVAEKIEAMSGAFVLARSAVIEMLELAEKGQLNVIVFDIPDRLGRGEAISKLELLAEMSGARIEFARPGKDRSTIEGFVQHSTDQLVSGIERLNIGRRTREGKQATARSGQFIATIYRPFGYNIVSHYDDHGRKVECHLEVIEDEAQVIRTIFDWCVLGGMSANGIARKLSAMGVPTATARKAGPDAPPGTPGKNRGQTWDVSTVRKMLHCKTYIGEWLYGKTNIKRLDALGKARYHVEKRPESEVITVPVPVIVSPELWAEAQRIMEDRRHKGNKPTTREYLLRGRVRCSRCGLRLMGSTATRGEYRYYRCRAHTSRYFGDRHCQAGNMPGILAENAVWDKLAELMQDRDNLLEKVRADREEALHAHKIIQTTICALKSQDDKGQAKLDRWLDMCGDGLMSKAAYAEKKRQVDAEIERRAAERADLEVQLRSKVILTPDLEAELLKLADDAALGMTHATFAERIRILDLLRVEGIYDDRADELTITGALGSHTLHRVSDRNPVPTEYAGDLQVALVLENGHQDQVGRAGRHGSI